MSILWHEHQCLGTEKIPLFAELNDPFTPSPKRKHPTKTQPTTTTKYTHKKHHQDNLHLSILCSYRGPCAKNVMLQTAYLSFLLK